MKSWKKVEQLTKRVNQLETKLNELREELPSKKRVDFVSRCRQGIAWLKEQKKEGLTHRGIATAVICALILGLTIYLLIQGHQWRSALSQLRSEPGIEILAVERAGFFKKRIIGLRDPLARNVPDILAKNGIDPAKVEVFLTEYLSLNTPFGKQRKEKLESDLSGLRDSLAETVGAFMDNSSKQRKSDLEKITHQLFSLRFPEEMKSVRLECKQDTWWAVGELMEPAYSEFKRESPKYIVEGSLQFEKLKNLTEIETSSLKQDIESLNLFARSDDHGDFVYLPMVQRLISDYDSICRASGISLPRLQIQIRTDNIAAHEDEIEQIQSSLEKVNRVTGERFLPHAVLPPEEGHPELRGNLNLISISSNQ